MRIRNASYLPKTGEKFWLMIVVLEACSLPIDDVEKNGSDSLEALRTAFVDSVLDGVPILVCCVRIVKIDQVNRRNIHLVQGHMIVIDSPDSFVNELGDSKSTGSGEDPVHKRRSIGIGVELTL